MMVAAGGAVDLWSNDSHAVRPTGPLDLGEVQLTDTQNDISLVVVGHNSANRKPHYQFGLDGLKIEKVG